MDSYHSISSFFLNLVKVSKDVLKKAEKLLSTNKWKLIEFIQRSAESQRLFLRIRAVFPLISVPNRENFQKFLKKLQSSRIAVIESTRRRNS